MAAVISPAVYSHSFTKERPEIPASKMKKPDNFGVPRRQTMIRISCGVIVKQGKTMEYF